MTQAPDYERILVHYAEIGTKRSNRRTFEERLKQNLKTALEGTGVGRFRRESGRLTAKLLDAGDLETICERLGRVPGVAWFAPACLRKPDVDEISDCVVRMAVAHPDSTFRLDTKRADKSFPLDSLAVNRAAGAAVVRATGRSVSLGTPDYRYGVEIDKLHSLVFWDRREGVGGLPVGSQGGLIALLSGGIDSPVAAFRMMVRGCRIHLVHFLNRSFATNRVSEKIRALAARLALFHGPLPLTMVPFDELQREIVMVVPAKYRMIVYRRVMFRVAERLRREDRALGFVTGDSVGQVASQTLENLHVIHEAADYPVYSPLAGACKSEITREAERIGTFPISILPHEDCCSFLVARHPETRASLGKIREHEVFDLEAGIDAALSDRIYEEFAPYV